MDPPPPGETGNTLGGALLLLSPGCSKNLPLFAVPSLEALASL